MVSIHFDFLEVVVYLGVKGGVCNKESDVIRSQEECSSAIEMLSYKEADDMWTGSYSSSIPSGCSARISSNSLLYPHFEESATGLGTGRLDLTPICKKSATSGNFHNCHKIEKRRDDLTNT